MPAPATSLRITLAARLVCAAALLAGAAGCRERAPHGAETAIRQYAVRAEVVAVPAPAGGARKLVIRHEAIDDFADASGTAVGMGAMVMPFDVAPSVALDDVRPGDKLEVRLAVGWTPPLLRIDSVRKLPAGTVLEFRAARPAPPSPR
jgi:Cu/Ag efflux protein CusF